MIKGYAAHEAGATLKPFEYDPGELGKDEVEIDVVIVHSPLEKK